jgi:hypothetical protein
MARRVRELRMLVAFQRRRRDVGRVYCRQRVWQRICGYGCADCAFRVSPSILSFSMPKFNTKTIRSLLPIKHLQRKGIEQLQRPLAPACPKRHAHIHVSSPFPFLKVRPSEDERCDGWWAKGISSSPGDQSSRKKIPLPRKRFRYNDPMTDGKACSLVNQSKTNTSAQPNKNKRHRTPR